IAMRDRTQTLPQVVAALLCCTLALVFGPRVHAAPDKAITFNRDIRPILSENCYACHGPDARQRKAKLRLDVKENATRPAKSGDTAIVPHDLEHSQLVARITTDDADDHMPPAESGKKLTAVQIDLLRRWIKEGAEYQGLW